MVCLSLFQCAATFSPWTDAISLAFGGFLLLCGGLKPRRPLWGSEKRNVISCLLIATIYMWNTARYIYEAVAKEPGPREFMLLTITYASQWLVTYIRMLMNPKWKRLYKVGQSLKELKMLQVGRSTHGRKGTHSENSDEKRAGYREIVIRTGVPAASGQPYWQGNEARVEGPMEGVTDGAWMVWLQEKNLYSNKLDAWGTIEYLGPGPNMEDLYKTVKGLILQADSKSLGDYSEFLKKWRPHAPDGTPDPEAQEVDERNGLDIEKVAMKVASDVLYYVSEKPSAQLRTEQQVQEINECIIEAADRVYENGIAWI